MIRPSTTISTPAQLAIQSRGTSNRSPSIQQMYLGSFCILSTIADGIGTQRRWLVALTRRYAAVVRSYKVSTHGRAYSTTRVDYQTAKACPVLSQWIRAGLISKLGLGSFTPGKHCYNHTDCPATNLRQHGRLKELCIFPPSMRVQGCQQHLRRKP
jgi:hypothetical protein